ncbi:MAG TPA: hypothetical protein ENN13_00915 [Candidatus Altiarchaeales archaeon]|nr:hypothetical protein [Candidatus Altiarchaeales archaeon]
MAEKPALEDLPSVGDEFRLLKGEKLLKAIKPHYMAFYDMYGIWVSVILVSVIFLLYGEQIAMIFGNPGLLVTQNIMGTFAPSENAIVDAVPFLTGVNSMVYSAIYPVNKAFGKYAQIPLWIGALFIMSIAFSVLKIDFKWAIMIPGTAIASLLLSIFLEIDAYYSYVFAMIISAAGMVLVELYRRAHNFYITDSRIVTQVEFISHKRNELEYDKINNLVIDQDLIARLFNFGVVIPITASGLGMGQDHALIALGAGGQSPLGGNVGVGVMGGRSINTPRARSMYSLFGIPEPEEIQHLISEQMRADNEAPLLREMSGILREIRDKDSGGRTPEYRETKTQAPAEPAKKYSKPAVKTGGKSEGNNSESW